MSRRSTFWTPSSCQRAGQVTDRTAGVALPAFAPDAALRAKLAKLSLVSQRPHGHLHTGGRRSRATGSSLEFADHRSYSPGDDYRQIDWNIYARTDELFVKIRESEETLVAHLLLDVSGSMSYGTPAKFDTARAVLAALGWTALASRDVVAGAVLGADLGETFAPRQGEAYVRRFFEFLQRQHPSGETGLPRAVSSYNARALPHGVAVLVSDLLAPDAPRAIGALAQRGHELTVIHVLDDDFVNPEFADEVELIDAEGGGTLEILGDVELLRAYRQAVGDWSSDLQRFCHRRHVRYVPIRSNWAVEEIVLRRLREHGTLA